MDKQTHSSGVKTWDIFCRVIDNYGDIGVCWRLCNELAARGQTVRLIVDDASALEWMQSEDAPNSHSVRTELVEVLAWDQAHHIDKPADVVVEAFGCELPESYIAKMSLKANTGVASQWINLEYLSAEPYAERNHLLPSPVMSGSGKGLVKTFFYPGFTNKTGGLLREADLSDRQARFDKAAWLKAQDIGWQADRNERIVSLFCYEPKALSNLIEELKTSEQPTLLLVTAGRANQAVKALQADSSRNLRIHYLPYLSHQDYDHLLWASDFNFVRGEDSLVRALWAGKPFVWQIYPQDDGAHHVKLDAFLDVYLANMDSETAAHIRKSHYLWNGVTKTAPESLIGIGLPRWQAASHTQSGLWATGLPELVDSLKAFVKPITSNHPAAPYFQTA
jgi:uncharacterized repeat protein (TIGR03837 family)